MESAFAPFEFGAQDAEEAVGAAAEESNACLGALAVDVVAETTRACRLYVDGGVDAGHDDGAVGGEVVGGGAGGGGDDDAVGAEGGDELAVDFDGEVAHAGDGAFGDDDVVEGVPLLEDLAVADVLGVHHAADLDLGAVVAPGFEGGVEVGERDLGEEAEGAEVHAEDGGGGAGEGSGCGEQGAVAAEDDDQVGLVLGQVDALDGVGGGEVGGAVGVEEVMVVACFEPRDEIAQDAGDFRLLRLGDDGGLEH